MTKNKEATRYYSSLQEQSVAKALNGHTTPNSGAATFAAGDVIVDEASLLVECKCPMTEKSSFSIKKEWLEKNKEEAFQSRMSNNCLCFNFGPKTQNYYVISEKLMKYLCEKLKEDC